MTDLKPPEIMDRTTSPHLSADILRKHEGNADEIRASSQDSGKAKSHNERSKTFTVTKSDTVSQTSMDRSLSSMINVKKKLNKWTKGKLSTMSVSDKSGKGKSASMQPTYKMEPEPGSKFSPATVQSIMEDSLQMNLDHVDKYDHKTASELTRFIADDIKQKVKLLKFDRYKIISQVIIGENLGQSIECASRGIWNMDNDTNATASYSSTKLFAIAMCFGVYHE